VFFRSFHHPLRPLNPYHTLKLRLHQGNMLPATCCLLPATCCPGVNAALYDYTVGPTSDVASNFRERVHRILDHIFSNCHGPSISLRNHLLKYYVISLRTFVCLRHGVLSNFLPTDKRRPNKEFALRSYRSKQRMLLAHDSCVSTAQQITFKLTHRL